MEHGKTQIAEHRKSEFSFDGYKNSSDANDNQRLNLLLKLNAETIRRKADYKYEFEQFEIGMMKNPLSSEKAFAYLGFLIGSFPLLTTLFLIFYRTHGNGNNTPLLFFGLIITVITSFTGYFTGKKVGVTVSNLENESWLKMLLLTPLVGLLWGIVSGGAGGLIVYLIGAVFGAIIGGAVGFALLPVFAVFHRLLKKGEFIEMRHFLPLALGIIFIICAFIIGL